MKWQENVEKKSFKKKCNAKLDEFLYLETLEAVLTQEVIYRRKI